MSRQFLIGVMSGKRRSSYHSSEVSRMVLTPHGLLEPDDMTYFPIRKPIVVGVHGVHDWLPMDMKQFNVAIHG